ncbi:MAG: acyltransferase [Clostridiales bacterium]|nr:acyltransferase [Clostridiales bacterium]
MECFTKRDTRILKGIAVILLLVHHSVAVLAETTFLSGTEILKQAVSLAKLCVAIFSVLSGYGLYVSFEKRKIKSPGKAAKFVGEHLWKVYSVFWLAAVIQLAVVALLRKSPGEIYGEHAVLCFLLDCLGLSYFTGTTRFVNSWWYITLVLVDYLIFPFLFILVKKLKRLNIPLLVVTALLMPVVCGSESIVIYSLFFLYGMIFAEWDLFTRLLNLPKKWQKIPVIFGCAVGLPVLCLLRQYLKSGWQAEYYMDWLISAVLIVFVSQCVHLIPWKGRGILETLGDYSFEIYIVHGMFLKFFSDYVYHDYFWGTVVLRLLAISAAAAWLLRKAEVLLRLPDRFFHKEEVL